jgi:glycosyltransferase involved in cell wall biosynthesis
MSDKDKPCISIGLPVYNGEQFLEKTLDSILAQTFKDFELIISDNASTDRTQEICQEYAHKDRRVRYYRNEKNIGAAPNYNRVFELSRGEYFKWASHDDLCAPEFFERCINVLKENPSVVLCFSKTVVIDEYGQFLRSFSNNLDLSSKKPYERFKKYRERLSKSNFCDPVFGMMRTSQLKTTPLIGSYISSDMTLLGELALLGEFYEIPENLFFRRHHPQMSVQANYDWEKRLRWFNPERKGKLLLPHWSLFLGYLSAINRVQFSWDEKLRCYTLMLSFLIEKQKLFTKELAINVGLILNISSLSIFNFKKNLPTFW